jgi:hypothetical protein
MPATTTSNTSTAIGVLRTSKNLPIIGHPLLWETPRTSPYAVAGCATGSSRPRHPSMGASFSASIQQLGFAVYVAYMRGKAPRNFADPTMTILPRPS